MERPMTGRWPLGCQTRPWLQRWGAAGLAARLPEVMRDLAAVGYAAFEVRISCLPLDDPAQFVAMREAAGGITLAGVHVVGEFWREGSAAAIPAIAADAARLPALGCDRVVVSVAPMPVPLSEPDLRRLTENLGALGRALRAVGVRLAYHNHAAEIAGDARVLAALVAGCAPEELMLGADLGWVAHAGMFVEEFLARFGARLDYAHVRDVTADGGFTEVGRGILDHGAILAALDACGYRGWLVAESEFGPDWRGADDLAETAVAQLASLRAAVSAYATPPATVRPRRRA